MHARFDNEKSCRGELQIERYNVTLFAQKIPNLQLSVKALLGKYIARWNAQDLRFFC